MDEEVARSRVEWSGGKASNMPSENLAPDRCVSKLSFNVIMVAFSVRAKFPFPPNTLFARATILLPILLCPVYAANLQHFKENIRL